MNKYIIHKAQDFSSALQSIAMFTYDVVILDVKGVNGFKLEKKSIKLIVMILILLNVWSYTKILNFHCKHHEFTNTNVKNVENLINLNEEVIK